MEITVNIVPGVMPIGYYILEIEIPDTASIYEITERQLPKEWRKMENFTQFVGYNIIRQQRHLALKVPSACIMHEYNYLINPAHPFIEEIRLLRSDPFEFDERLFNTGIRIEQKTVDRPATEEDLKNFPSYKIVWKKN